MNPKDPFQYAQIKWKKKNRRVEEYNDTFEMPKRSKTPS